MKTGFIGAGNMGGALIAGLARARGSGEGLFFYDPDEGKTEEVRVKYGAVACASCGEVAAKADTLVICVKPDAVEGVIGEIRGRLDGSKLLICAAAGVSTRAVEAWAGEGVPVVRAMPNTPAVIGMGLTAVCPGKYSGEEHLGLAGEVFGAAGDVVRVAEDMMDAVTAVSGSGPAYLFLLAEAMEEGARRAGLDPELSGVLVRKTLAGASALLSQGGESARELRRRVSSPGGTTEAALERLEKGDFRRLVTEAVGEAGRRAAWIRQRISKAE